MYRVSCGEPVFFNDSPEEWQVWPVMMTGPVDGIMLVQGESMLGAGIRPGDQIFFQLINGRRPQSGDTVVAEVEGGAVCKLYQRNDAGEFLMSAPGDQDAAPFLQPITPAVRLVGIVKKRLTDV